MGIEFELIIVFNRIIFLMQLGLLWWEGHNIPPPHPNSQGLPIKNTHIDLYWYLEKINNKVLKICWLYFYPGFLQIITMEFLKFPILSIFAPFLRSRKNRWQHIYIYIRVWFWNSSKKIYPNINKRNKRDRLKKKEYFTEKSLTSWRSFIALIVFEKTVLKNI